jgi:uncharacterized protein YkwD/uncharacterized membrane protein required for colicin V production
MLLNIFQSFNGVDAFLVFLLLFCIWAGWQKGFMLGAVDLVKWITGLLIAFAGYKYVAALIEKITVSLGVWLYPVSFIIILILAGILLSWLTRQLLRTIPKESHVSITNKILGIIPGFFNGLIYVIVCTALLLSLPLFDGLSSKTKDSIIGSGLSDKIEWIDEKVSPVFDEAIRKTMTGLTVEPGSDKIVKLHYTVRSPRVRPDLEEKMLVLVNDERAKTGLPALKADPEMTAVARAHSADMFARGYFSHYTPEGRDPYDRIKTAKVRFIIAGENLALGQTLNICHKGLMKSPGHRANILRPSFGRLGIGVLDGGRYGLMITQEFRN